MTVSTNFLTSSKAYPRINTTTTSDSVLGLFRRGNVDVRRQPDVGAAGTPGMGWSPERLSWANRWHLFGWTCLDNSMDDR